jgi:hypothetical protein
VIADTTIEGSEKLVSALTDISNTNKEMEGRKMDLQKEIHDVNLAYKRERDRTVAKNMRVSLLHQSAVVIAISNLSEALGHLKQGDSPQSQATTSAPPIPMTNTVPMESIEQS